VIIEFAGEAYESFQQALEKMVGYGVTITPLEDGEPFEAVLIGPSRTSEWGDAVEYREVDNDFNARGDIKTIRVEKVEVH
jgi:hypothetical protein